MQPFSTAHLLAIMTLLATPTSLASWAPVLKMAVLTAFSYAISTGARKDEWTSSFARVGPSTPLRRFQS